MNVATIHTKQFSGLDYRVWLVMGTSCLLSLGFIIYKQVQNNSIVSPCASLPVSVDGRQKGLAVCPPNRLVIFKLDVPSSTQVEWDFDDGTPLFRGPIAQHKFTKEGTYTVEATVNDRCRQRVDVVVKEGVVGDHVKPDIQIFCDSAKAMVGTRLHFSVASYPGAKTYQWLVQETGEKGEGENTSFVFAKAGTYIVQVTADNDASRQRLKQIVISNLPPPPVDPMLVNPPPGGMPSLSPLLPPGTPGAPPPGPGAQADKKAAAPPVGTEASVVKSKATEIDPEAFKPMLQAVLKEEGDLSGLYQYLPYKETTQVAVEGERGTIALRDFCKKYKKREIETLRFQKDDQNQSVQQIVLKLKRRGLLGRMFGG